MCACTGAPWYYIIFFFHLYLVRTRPASVITVVVEDIYFSSYRQYAAYVITYCNPTNIFLIMNTNNAKHNE